METKDTVYRKQTPEWTKDKVIYEVNLRQYSEEGTFAAFEKHLPRLKELGVDILWFMPIQPIGIKNRKGTLGSYYSISDYTGVNSEFGTLTDFKNLVEKCHSMGMYVLIDWVANHTAWDNKWIELHPNFYVHDSSGNIISPVPDWTDVADLNYENKGLWKAQAEAMIFWLKEANIDGFRCDVAGMCPVEFWNFVRPELDKVKKVFMLAEWEDPAFQEKAFDMHYTWEFHHLIHDIAQGKKKVSSLNSYFDTLSAKWQPEAIHMYFTSNHDENSWNGTDQEKFHYALEAMNVLCFTIPGMPLIYSGQEAGNTKRLKFFDKDVIEWKEDKLFPFYKKMILLKKDNPALWNGLDGGEFKIVAHSHPDNVFAFTRVKNYNRVIIFANLTADKVVISADNFDLDGDYKEYFSDITKHFGKSFSQEINPWGYQIWVAK